MTSDKNCIHDQSLVLLYGEKITSLFYFRIRVIIYFCVK